MGHDKTHDSQSHATMFGKPDNAIIVTADVVGLYSKLYSYYYSMTDHYET